MFLWEDGNIIYNFIIKCLFIRLSGLPVALPVALPVVMLTGRDKLYFCFKYIQNIFFITFGADGGNKTGGPGRPISPGVDHAEWDGIPGHESCI